MKLFEILIICFICILFICIGISMGVCSMKRQAIQSGVGKYIITNTNSGKTEFIFISPQTKTN